MMSILVQGILSLPSQSVTVIDGRTQNFILYVFQSFWLGEAQGIGGLARKKSCQNLACIIVAMKPKTT